MFGYIRAYAPELRVREYEFYRAVYCGLCRANGRRTGCASRFALSYDFVFLAIVRLALTGGEAGFVRRRCAAHPATKRSEMTRNAQLDFCASAAALLAYHKLRDDIGDESGKKKLRALAALPFARRMRRRALRQIPGLDEKIRASLDALSRTEREGVASVDIPAGIFGEITEEILAYGLEPGATERIAREIGRHIGKWIYIADALDDYPEDIKKGRYNPFACLPGGGEMTESERDGIRAALLCELAEAERAFDLMEYGGRYGDTLRALVSNIIYLGMPRRIEDILSGGACQKNREDIQADERSV